VFPFLRHGRLASTGPHETTEQPPTHPSNPSTAVLAKSHLPGGFQRLEEFIGLEEGAHAERVEDAKCHEEQQDVLQRGLSSGAALRAEDRSGQNAARVT
jgi:hypothetical protein